MTHLTKVQVAALKYMIAHSYDGSKFLKQLLWVMIDRSDSLSKEVGLTLVEGEVYNSDEIHGHALLLSSMQSCNGLTHLDQMICLAGSDLHFSVHYGAYEGEKFDSLGIFPGMEDSVTGVMHPTDAVMRYTFWLAKKSYGHSGKPSMLEVSKEEIESVNLRQPRLHPELEDQPHWKEDHFPHRFPRHLYGPPQLLRIDHYH